MPSRRPWLRLYTALRTDPRMLALDDGTFRLAINLLCLFGESSRPGYIEASPGVPYSYRALAQALSCDQRSLKKRLEKLVASGTFGLQISSRAAAGLQLFSSKWAASNPADPMADVRQRLHRARYGPERDTHRDESVTPTVTVTGESRVDPPPNPPPASGGGSGGKAGYVKGDGVRGDADSPTPSLQSTPSDAVPRPTPPLPPPDADSGAVDPALGDVVRAYETATRRPISPSAAVRLGELCAEHIPANVARAIERVAQRGDAVRMRSPAYLLPVLREMAQAGDDGVYSPRGRAVDAPYNIR